MSRILVVDDDLLVSRIVQFWLIGRGHDVVLAHGEADGLAALAHDRFDLVVVDIFMPHMEGFETVRVFHAAAPEAPLIAMSGYAFAEGHSPAPDFLRMALALGATNYIRKPFRPSAFLALVKESLGGTDRHIEPIVAVSRPEYAEAAPRSAEN